MFHLGVRAGTSHMTVSTPTGRLYGFDYLFIYLFQLVTKIGEYLYGATPPRNCCLYFSLLSRVISEVLIAQQWYVGSAGMSSHNLAFMLLDRVWAGYLLIPSTNEQKFSSVFLIAELRGVEERKSKLPSEKWPGIE